MYLTQKYQILKKSELFKKVISGSFWNGLLNIWGKGISFIGTLIIIRFLGRESFGEFGMINSTILMFGLFSTFTLSQTTTKYVAEYKNVNKIKTGRIIGLSLLFSLIIGLFLTFVVFIYAYEIAVYSLNAAHLAQSIQLMAIGLFFSSLNGVQNGVIAGFESYKSNAIVSIFLTLFLTILKVLLTYKYGFNGAIIGMTLEPIISFLITRILVSKLMTINKIDVSYKKLYEEISIFYKFSLPTLLIGVIVYPTNWYVMSLLTKTENGYFNLGGFNAANQWFNLLIFIPYILVSTFLPIFTNLIIEKKIDLINKIIKNSIYLLMIIFFPIIFFFMIFGNKISIFIYGSEFDNLGLLLTLSVIAVIPQGISIVFEILFTALNKIWLLLFMYVLWSLTLITSTYYFIDNGALSIFYSKIIAYSINLILLFSVYVKWKKRFK